MARKRVKQRAAVGVLGKALTRRSKGHCELCEGRQDVRPYELPPFPDAPVLERSLMACGRCRAWLEGADIPPMEAHFLASAVWSHEPAVRLAAARLLLAVAEIDDPWVHDALEQVDVDPVTQEFRHVYEADAS